MRAKKPAQCRAKSQYVADFDAGCLGQPIAHSRLIESEDEVVGPQARHVAIDVEPFERIVERIRQKDAFEIRSLPNLLVPVRSLKGVGGFAEENIAIGGGEFGALKAEKVRAISISQEC